MTSCNGGSRQCGSASLINRRKYLRQPINLVYHLVGLFGSLGTTLDLSPEGTRVYSNRKLAQGAEYQIKFFLSQRPLSLKARVIWIRPAPEEAAAQYEVGLQFLNLGKSEQKKLLSFSEPPFLSNKLTLRAISRATALTVGLATVTASPSPAEVGPNSSTRPQEQLSSLSHPSIANREIQQLLLSSKDSQSLTNSQERFILKNPLVPTSNLQPLPHTLEGLQKLAGQYDYPWKAQQWQGKSWQQAWQDYSGEIQKQNEIIQAAVLIGQRASQEAERLHKEEVAPREKQQKKLANLQPIFAENCQSQRYHNNVNGVNSRAGTRTNPSSESQRLAAEINYYEELKRHEDQKNQAAHQTQKIATVAQEAAEFNLRKLRNYIEAEISRARDIAIAREEAKLYAELEEGWSCVHNSQSCPEQDFKPNIAGFSTLM